MAQSMSSELVGLTAAILRNLQSSPYPILESPESQKRRASVAFIIRVQPSYAHWPTNNDNATSIDEFFEQDWVKHGELEVLFIKRASRKGDRWTSHIALPGGKRDPGDADDKAAAIREANEEVGLDLNACAIEVGNLPQRLVTTHWGKLPLMVLCPYVFLVTTHQVPPLRLQPTEVASTHWVPLRSLLSPAQRTVVYDDVSSKLANQETGVRKWMLSSILGKMVFAAINLVPSESIYSVETPGSAAIQLQDNRFVRQTIASRLQGLASRIGRGDWFNQFPPPAKDGPLLLWGLTLGVILDFLDLIPPHNALTLWTYPTFTPIDVQFAIWLLTYRFKERKRAELQSGTLVLHRPSFGSESESLAASAVITGRPDETGLHGLGSGNVIGDDESKKWAVSTMLDGYVDRIAALFLPAIADRARYYVILRRAVLLALLNRVGVATVVFWVAYRRFYKRQVK